MNKFHWKVTRSSLLTMTSWLKLLINLHPFAVNGLCHGTMSFPTKGQDDKHQIFSYKEDYRLSKLPWSNITHGLQDQVTHLIQSMTFPQIYFDKGYHLKFEHVIINYNFSLTFYDFISSYNSLLSYHIIRLTGKSHMPGITQRAHKDINFPNNTWWFTSPQLL